jgi:hypothetical protein
MTNADSNNTKDDAPTFLGALFNILLMIVFGIPAGYFMMFFYLAMACEEGWVTDKKLCEKPLVVILNAK